MNVYLSPNGLNQIPGDLIVRWVLRSDLAPVPRTVEMTLRIKNGIEEKLSEGSRFWTGRELLEYTVVKVHREKPVALIQGEDQMATFSITALLSSCARIAYRRERAVIRENARLGALYRECGASAAISDDFPVRRFACFVGQVPSYHLAQAMQEESAVIVLRRGRVSVARIGDLMAQDPLDVIGQTDSTDLIESEFLQRHEIPACISVDDAGAFLTSDPESTRAVIYLPRSDERMLKNMSRVLVVRRIVDSRLAEEINAGDVIEVAGERHVVITAAHSMEQSEGIMESASRFWVGSPSA